MNVILWIAQGILALHTAMGAVWKFSHSAEQTMPSLAALSPVMWRGLSIIEICCSIGLVAPALHRPLMPLVPIGAAVIALEMVLFSVLHLASEEKGYAPIIYWLVVAVVCGFVSLGRLSTTSS